jgi:signal peptidase I
MSAKRTPPPGPTAGRLDPADAAFAGVVSEVLSRGHSVRFRAKGASMHPAIRDGEIVTVAPVQPAEIRRGDVILYRFRGGVIAHRVASIGRGTAGTLVFVVRGDAFHGCDEPVDESALLGRVVTAERGGRALDPSAFRARAVAAFRSAVAGFLRWLRAWLPRL